MSKTILREGDDGVVLIVKDVKDKHPRLANLRSRSPIHVVYGGAHLFAADTPRKLGSIALRSIRSYTRNISEFARAFNLPGSEELPSSPRVVRELERRLKLDAAQVRRDEPYAWLAFEVMGRTIAKLKREPVEDFRVDFEDGYGLRTDDDEDRHAGEAARSLATAIKKRSAAPFNGIRIKPLAAATEGRAERTLEIFLREMMHSAASPKLENFCVTLPKVAHRREIKKLCGILDSLEKKLGLPANSIDIEIMIETPQAIIDRKGRVPLRGFAKSAKKRRLAAHFGAYDFTAALSIAAPLQGLNNTVCDYARSVMITALAPLGVRVSDSVTTRLPVPLHRGETLSAEQNDENRSSVIGGWREHAADIARSMSAGFYQSWDLHPNQLCSRYAAVYSFYLANAATQAERLKSFREAAKTAALSGATFEDAASARGVVEFFLRAADCGAITEDEIGSLTQMTQPELQQMFG